MAINHENEEAQVENTEPSISENDTNDSHSSTQSSEEFLANFDWFLTKKLPKLLMKKSTN